MARYSEFNKLAVKVGLKLIGHSVLRIYDQRLFRIDGLTVIQEAHNCRLCWSFAKRWIDKKAEWGKHRIRFYGPMSSPNSFNEFGVAATTDFCDYYMKNVEVTDNIKALLVRKPGAGNYKNKSAKPLNKQQKVKEEKDASRWDVDLDM